jgi:hypothetical protein
MAVVIQIFHAKLRLYLEFIYVKYSVRCVDLLNPAKSCF